MHFYCRSVRKNLRSTLHNHTRRETHIDYRIRSGKSNILNALVAYCQGYCQKIGHLFNGEVIRLSALTGAAATEIKGSTVHSECKLHKRCRITNIDICQWANTRLLVIDEISFAGYQEVLQQLSKRLQQLSEENEIAFGKIPIVFIGDFMQLEPINSKDAIYKTEESYYWEEQLNILVELQGKWRFKDCPKLQETFDVIRKEGITARVRDIINQRVVGTNNVELPKIAEKIKVATYRKTAETSVV